MWTFIRRLFVLLVLFTIVFLIYRYINPEGANLFVEKVKSVSDIFQNNELDTDDIDITGTTVGISGDINIVDDNINIWDNLSWEVIEEDMSWLEELNAEIDEILWKNNWTWDNLEDSAVDEDVIWSWNNDEIENMSGDLDEMLEVVEQEQAKEEDAKNEVKEELKKVPTKPADSLSDLDYEQIENVFGNLVE